MRQEELCNLLNTSFSIHIACVQPPFSLGLALPNHNIAHNLLTI